jgi:hypothetical protein
VAVGSTLFRRREPHCSLAELLYIHQLAQRLRAADIGRDLMRKVFDVKTGPLTDMTAEPAERRCAVRTQDESPSFRVELPAEAVIRCI